MKNIEKSRYYGPLIHYKVELDYLKIVSWINIFLSFFIYKVAIFNDSSIYYKITTKYLLITTMIIFVYSFLKKIINKFKKLSYILLSLNFAILQINFNFLGLMFFLGANKELMNQLYSEKAIFYILLIILISLISSLIYLWYYFPKNQGKQWSINQMWKGEKNLRMHNIKLIF